MMPMFVPPPPGLWQGRPGQRPAGSQPGDQAEERGAQDGRDLAQGVCKGEKSA